MFLYILTFLLDVPSSSKSSPLPNVDYQVLPPPPPDKKQCLETTSDQNFYEINQQGVNTLANQLRNWLHKNPSISQVRFAKHVLDRTQGTLSQLLKLRYVPTSRAGEKVWFKIKDFLNDKKQQEILLKECGGPYKLKGIVKKYFHCFFM